MEETDLSKSFIDFGFTIENAHKFTQELSANNIEPLDLLNKLITLQKQANSNVTIVDFSKNMLNLVNKLDTYLKSDELFHRSDASILSSIKSDMASITAHFDAIRGYLKAQENTNIQKNNVLEVKKAIYNLNKNQNISDEKKTNETLDLQSRLKACESAYKEAMAQQEKYKKEYNSKIGSTKVEDFKNELLASINSLSKSCQSLALNEETKKNVDETIRSMRNTTAYYALDNIKSQNEFDALCAKYHLKFDETKSNTKDNEVKQKEKEKDEVKEDELTPEPSKTSNGEPIALPGKSETSKQEPSTPETPEESKTNTSTQSDEPEFLDNEEPKIKVVAKRACKWLNKHKKQILIAVGISLLIVATIVAIEYLVPAITSMIKASEVASLSSAMVNNGAAWHAAIASEQAALHSANTALASAIQTITGNQAIFNVGSGVWTIGGAELGHFTAAATAAASNASAAVSSISNAVLALGVGGLGVTGLGALLNQNKSEEYIALRSKIRKLNQTFANISHEEVITEVNNIVAEIEASNITIDEKNRLIKKAKKIISKSQTYDKVDEKLENLTGGKTR